MRKLFSKNETTNCCLCGATSQLTGEHKIKASQVRREFDNRSVLFVRNDENSRPKLAQSPKSKVFHFEKAKVCRRCNSDRTQSADIAFDQFHASKRLLFCDGSALSDVKGDTVEPANGELELNVFRYFAKILCCFLAEVEGPRPNDVAEFAIGQSQVNYVLLSVSPDETYRQLSEQNGDFSYASHGGLVCYFDPRRAFVRTIESSLTIGGVKYTFGMNLHWYAKLELQLYHSQFVRFARKASRNK